MKRIFDWLEKAGTRTTDLDSIEDPRSEKMVERGSSRSSSGGSGVRILRKGPAMRVIFFYPGEEGTYVDHSEVTLYENGIVHIKSNHEETTTFLQNCEILWTFETESEDRVNKVRLLKPKSEQHRDPEPDKPSKGSSKNPELR